MSEAHEERPTDRREVARNPGLSVDEDDVEYDAAAQELISRAAGLAYPIRDGVPLMTRRGGAPSRRAAARATLPNRPG